MVADPLLTGALNTARVVAGPDGADPADDEVAAAKVSYTASMRWPRASTEPPSYTWLHLPIPAANDIDARSALALIARGIGLEVTAGVAADAAAEASEA